MVKTNPSFIASDPNISAWVAANAGAGKTYLLVTRLVRLMLNGVAPERLLCLTFTRNAAAEMQNRLFALLADWALLDDDTLAAEILARTGQTAGVQDLAHARQLFARALETPGGLRVQTIHGFCESLLHRFPLEAGLSPQFTLMDEQQTQSLIYEQSYQVLSQRADDTDLWQLTRHLSEDDFLKCAKDIITHKDVVKRIDIDAWHETVWQNSNLTPFAPDEITRRMIDFCKEVSQKATPLCEALHRDGGKTDKAAAARIRAMSAKIDTDDIDIIWPLAKNIFLTATDETLRKKPFTKAIHDTHPALSALYDEWAENFYALYQLHQASMVATSSAALCRFAKALVAAYEDYKKQHGVLDYDDLILHTEKLLAQENGASWVMYKIDGGIEHILIDEAQDTSPPQWHIIAALVREFFAGLTSHEDATRTIFAVGDEKQSIYSFQGAAPAAFADMKKEFTVLSEAAGKGFKTIPLQTSWRSVPQILEIVDRVFAGEHHDTQRKNDKGLVELWDVETSPRPKGEDDFSQIQMADRPATPAEKLAKRIAQKIRFWLGHPEYGIEEKDILILVRKRRPFAELMIAALHQQGIKVSGADRLQLLEDIAIKDLLIAGKVALLPQDDLALATLLRSPLFDISEEDLFTLRQGNHPQKSFWENLQADKSKIAMEIVEQMNRLIARAAIMRPFDFYMHILTADEGQKKLAQRLGNEIQDPINAFLDMALSYEQTETPNLQGFLQWLEQTNVELKRDLEQGHQAVRVMTVHAAKGLEAPIVFLPDTCQRGGSNKMRAAFINDSQGLLWTGRKKERLAYQHERIEEQTGEAQAEERRLLYVAMTRARDRLYIGGYLQAGQDDTKIPEMSWYCDIAKILRQDKYKVEAEKTSIWRYGDEVPLAKEDPEAVPAEKLRGVTHKPDWLEQDAPEMPAVQYVQPSGAENLSWRAASKESAQAAKRGRLIHYLLEHLPQLPAVKWEIAATQYIQNYANDYDEAARKNIVEKVTRLLNHVDFSDIFSSPSRAEAAMIGQLDCKDGTKMMVNGQVDRLVETENEILLIDFKSGQHNQKPAMAYQQQMAFYYALTRQIYQDKTIKCLLVWTEHAQITEISMPEISACLDESGIDVSHDK